jgi:hypothetical protein
MIQLKLTDYSILNEINCKYLFVCQVNTSYILTKLIILSSIVLAWFKKQILLIKLVVKKIQKQSVDLLPDDNNSNALLNKFRMLRIPD